MASMIFPDGSRTYDLAKIRDKLGQIGITLRDWSVPAQPNIAALLNKAALSRQRSRGAAVYLRSCEKITAKGRGPLRIHR